MRVTSAKSQQLQIRATARQKERLAEAAGVRHMNVSQFVLSTSLLAAEEVLAERERIAMGADRFEAFCRMLDEKPRAIPALAEQFERLKTRG